MRVLFATSECVPFFKLGGLGDVSHSLPVALSQLGVFVTVCLPFYEKIKVKDVSCLGPIAVDYAGKRELVFLFKSKIPKTHVTVLLFRHPRLANYTENTFLFYDVCVSLLYQRAQSIVGLSFDILHCNDWHTALVPLMIGEANKYTKEQETVIGRGAKTMLTIHNLLYQGVMPLGVVKDTGLPLSTLHPIGTTGGKYVNSFREGLEHVDVVSTVSPSYAKEILSPSFGPHVYDVLRKRGDPIVGILNGIDTDVWNPETDVCLPINYSKETVLEGKKEAKQKLQKAVGLPISNDLLFGFVGRIEPRQKGIDLIMQAIRRMPKRDFQIVLLGVGDKKQMKELRELDKDQTHIAYVDTFDERLARRIYAASDVMLVPSKFEPCGLIQMIAMRYGSIPLVRKTGGLADSVEDGKTGFVFEGYHVEDLCRVMWKTIVFREDRLEEWNRMVVRIMKEDFSWKASARQYVSAYKKLASTNF